MMSRKTIKPVTAAIGAALTSSMMLAGAANAAAGSNPFGLAELNAGYAQVADAHMEGKCGAGKCGAGKCGGAMTKDAEGKCGGTMTKDAEGKCGAGKCGGAMLKGAEGKCGAGKCGAGKCGGAMQPDAAGK